MLNIRHYSAQLEFFRSLAEGRQTPQVPKFLVLITKMHGTHTEAFAMWASQEVVIAGSHACMPFGEMIYAFTGRGSLQFC